MQARRLTPQQLLKKFRRVAGQQTFADLKPRIVAEIERRRNSCKDDDRLDAKGLSHLLAAVEREIDCGDAGRAAYFAFLLCGEGLEKVAKVGLRQLRSATAGGLATAKLSPEQRQECALALNHELVPGVSVDGASRRVAPRFGVSYKTVQRAYEVVCGQKPIARTK
ncbi:MAG: hypothetical protein WD894_20280 [Pirellulales bacterium]